MQKDKRKYFYKNILLFVVVIFFMGVGLLTAFFSERALKNQVRTRFETRATDLTSVIFDHLELQINSLYDIKGLFESSDSVERDEFQKYFRNDLFTRIPGITAVNYAKKVLASDVDNFENSTRSDTSIDPDGYPGYTLKIPQVNDEYYIYHYLEPFHDSDPAFGQDIFFETDRKNAIQKAVDSNSAVATSKIQLFGDNEGPGFNIFVPVYKNEMPINTVEERRAAIDGVITGIFKVDILFNSILEQHSLDGLDFTVFDRVDNSPTLLLFSTQPEINQNLFDRELLFDKNIDVSGSSWNLHFTASELYPLTSVEKQVPLIAFVSITIIGLLLSLGLYLLLSSTERAQKMAETLTQSLKDSESKYRLIFESLQDVYYRADMQGLITVISPSIEKYIGKTPEELIGTPAKDFYSDPEERDQMLSLLMKNGSINDFIIALKGKNGGSLSVSLNSHVVFDSLGKPIAIEGVLRDVTERATAEKEIHRMNKIMIDRELKMVELKKELKEKK